MKDSEIFGNDAKFLGVGHQSSVIFICLTKPSFNLAKAVRIKV